MIRDKLLGLRSRIEAACRRLGRKVEDVGLTLVTKQVEIDSILEAYELGVRDFGENRVQEWLDKKPKLPDDIRWHLIGHLQTNKVRFCVGETNLIHSVDTAKLAAAIDNQAKKRNLKVECLIQVNTSGEPTKHGVLPDELVTVAAEILKCSNLRICGLMTLGPLTEDSSAIRSAFRTLRESQEGMKKMFPQQNWHYLSMGMSSDFEIALEEGANLLRIGTAVFGERGKE